MARSARASPDLAPPGIITPPQSTKAKMSSPLAAATAAATATKAKVTMRQEEQENTDPQVATPPSSSPTMPISPQS